MRKEAQELIFACLQYAVLQRVVIKFCSIQKLFVTLQRAFGVCYKPAQQAGRTEKNTVRLLGCCGSSEGAILT